MFTTNVGNIGGDTGDEAAQTLVAILASAKPNPDFAPSRPEDAYEAMSTPSLGSVAPESSWGTFTSEAGNVTVRYPSTWTVEDDGDIVWLVAPSGYVVDLLTNGSGGSRCAGSEPLGTVDQAQTQSQAGVRPEVRWVDSGEYPVWVGLTHPDGSGCCTTGLSFGGTDDVYLGSTDNVDNPTPDELEQAVAILASARRAG